MIAWQQANLGQSTVQDKNIASLDVCAAHWRSIQSLSKDINPLIVRGKWYDGNLADKSRAWEKNKTGFFYQGKVVIQCPFWTEIYGKQACAVPFGVWWLQADNCPTHTKIHVNNYGHIFKTLNKQVCISVPTMLTTHTTSNYYVLLAKKGTLWQLETAHRCQRSGSATDLQNNMIEFPYPTQFHVCFIQSKCPHYLTKNF